MPQLRFVGARIAPTPRESGGRATPTGRFTPIGRMRKGGFAAALPVWFYREDAKGSAAHSVRDRLTALLAKPLRLAGACAAPAPRESAGRFTPVLKMKRCFAGERGGSAAALPVWFYREDAKGKRGSFRPRQTDRASCEADVMPEGCFAIFRKLRKSCKGRASRTQWPDGPAMPPLRLAGACAAPAPRESAGRFTPILKKASQDSPRVARSCTLLVL